MREELVRRSVDQVAKLINRTPKAVRNMLRRNHLTLGEIRCDQFSVHCLAKAVHIRKAEIVFWIEQKWLHAPAVYEGKRCRYIITPEALRDFLRDHREDLMKRRIRNLPLFEAYADFCYAPKHTVGKQLLGVRSDKRERAAFAEAQRGGPWMDGEEEEDDDVEDDLEERYGIEMVEVDGGQEARRAKTSDRSLPCRVPVRSSRESVCEIALDEVCGKGLLSIGIPVFPVAGQRAEDEPHRSADRMVWAGPVENWNQ